VRRPARGRQEDQRRAALKERNSTHKELSSQASIRKQMKMMEKATAWRDGLHAVATAWRDGLYAVATAWRDGLHAVATAWRDGLHAVTAAGSLSTCNCMERRTACCHRRRVTLYLHAVTAAGSLSTCTRVFLCARVSLSHANGTRRALLCLLVHCSCCAWWCARAMTGLHDAESAIESECLNHNTFTDDKIGCVSQ
jgi:hypothetical protein